MWGLFEEKGWGGLAGMEGEDRWYLGLLGHDSKIVLGLVSVFNLFTVFVFDLPKRIFGVDAYRKNCFLQVSFIEKLMT